MYRQEVAGRGLNKPHYAPVLNYELKGKSFLEEKARKTIKTIKNITTMGKFDIGAIGQEAAGSALGAVMGLALEGHNDRRQIRQEERLGRQQMAFNKEMAEFQRQQQLQLWKDTNYAAQVGELKKAGLNVGLMYGMSGGGGATAAAGTGAPVTGGHAPRGGGESMGLMMAGQQAALMAAQIDNVKAGTEKTKTETQKIAGVDTQEAQSRIQNLAAETANTYAKEQLTKIDSDLKKVELEVAQGSKEDRLDAIYYAAQSAIWQTEMLERSNGIQKATKDAVIQEVRARSIGAWIENVAKRQGIEVQKAQISKMAADIAQGWKGLDNKEREIQIQKFKAEFEANHPGLWNVIGKEIEDGITELGELHGDKWGRAKKQEIK